MTGVTHAAAGVCTALALSAPAGGVILAGLGGLLCDIDCATSTIGKRVKVISVMFEHRSFTHSLLFAALCSILNLWLALGILTHILLDMMTPAGVRLLWPYKRKVRLPFARFNENNSLFEQIFQAVLIVACVVLALAQSELGIAPLLRGGKHFVDTIKSLFI